MSNDPSSPGGHGNPPSETRFKKGQSGNPRGRPKRRIEAPPYEAVLGQLVLIKTENGQQRSVTLEEAFLRRIFNQGLNENIAAGIHSLKIIDRLKRIYNTTSTSNDEFVFINNFLFSVNDAMLPLKMVQKLNRDGPSPRILMEPWLVEAALARLGSRVLTAEEQREVWGATHTPNKVRWPPWWTERRGTGRRRPKAPLEDADGFFPPCVIPRRTDDGSKRQR